MAQSALSRDLCTRLHRYDRWLHDVGADVACVHSDLLVATSMRAWLLAWGSCAVQAHAALVLLLITSSGNANNLAAAIPDASLAAQEQQAAQQTPAASRQLPSSLRDRAGLLLGPPPLQQRLSRGAVCPALSLSAVIDTDSHLSHMRHKSPWLWDAASWQAADPDHTATAQPAEASQQAPVMVSAVGADKAPGEAAFQGPDDLDVTDRHNWARCSPHRHRLGPGSALSGRAGEGCSGGGGSRRLQVARDAPARKDSFLLQAFGRAMCARVHGNAVCVLHCSAKGGAKIVAAHKEVWRTSCTSVRFPELHQLPRDVLSTPQPQA